MAESDKTWIELEVLHCSETGFRAAGESAAAGWLCFDIRQPKYPRRSAPITIIHTPENPSSDLQEGLPLNEATRKTLPVTIIGKLVIRSRAKSASETANTKIGVFEYWQSWTAGGHTEEEGYGVTVDILAGDFDRIQNWAFAGRHPSLITVYTPDISYDYPGGYRSLKWAVVGTSARADIFDISFHYNPEPLPVVLVSNEEGHVREARVEAELEHRQAMHLIANNSNNIPAELQAIGSQLKVLISIAVALVPLILFAAWEHGR